MAHQETVRLGYTLDKMVAAIDANLDSLFEQSHVPNDSEDEEEEDDEDDDEDREKEVNEIQNYLEGMDQDSHQLEQFVGSSEWPVFVKNAKNTLNNWLIDNDELTRTAESMEDNFNRENAEFENSMAALRTINQELMVKKLRLAKTQKQGPRKF